MDKTQLIEDMKTILASVFSLYLKTHNYHWNVTGPNFAQYHGFFGDFYDALHDSVDDYAEHIRALGAFSPGSLKRFSEITKVQDEMSIPSTKFMFIRLYTDNETVLNLLKDARNLAEQLKEGGILNFLEERIDWHEKMQWQLKAFEE